MMRFYSISWSLILAVLISGTMLACRQEDDSITEGARLAQTHCGSCHLPPSPSLLDAEQWMHVLPAVGYRLGIYGESDRDSLVASMDLRGVDTVRVFPSHASISAAQFDDIQNYYLAHAAEEMGPVRRERDLVPGLPNFEIRKPSHRIDRPLTLVAKILPGDRRFILANYGYREHSSLSVHESTGARVRQWTSPDAPIRVHVDAGRMYVLFAGPGPEPTEASLGSLIMLEAPRAEPEVLLTGLKRPIDMEIADLNGDEVEDLLICEYGHEAGFLSLYEGDGRGGYQRRVLAEEAGAVRAVIHDFDDSGSPDLGVLMAQGDEGFDIYLNDGGGGFTRVRKLRFPPIYGSNDIQLADFNDDGRMDLLYVNGDNADFTPVTKPYHGLRIYLADGQGDYKEEWFFPLPGASSARIRDFDGDGDLDIAAIAYFADFVDEPEAGFVYLENAGDLTFEGRTITDARLGRWLTMDAGDVDGDGDEDILLGSNIGFSPRGDTTGLFEDWSRGGLPYVLLENSLR